MNLFFLQLKGELQKMFARKRSYIGFGAFVAIECLFVFLLNLPRSKESFRHLIEQSGYGFETYFSGLTLALILVLWTTFLPVSLYLALVAGDVVAKEVEDGTMRMILCRPVSRVRIIFLKLTASLIYTFTLVVFIGITALVAGFSYRGVGGFFVFAPLEKIFALYEFREGLMRYAWAIPLLTVSMATITCLGFMFSCFNMKPAAATIVTLSIFFIDFVFRNIPYFESYKHFFLTTHMSTWLNIFREYIPWSRMAEDYAYLFGMDATFVLIGLAMFQRRDFKS